MLFTDASWARRPEVAANGRHGVQLSVASDRTDKDLGGFLSVLHAASSLVDRHLKHCRSAGRQTSPPAAERLHYSQHPWQRVVNACAPLVAQQHCLSGTARTLRRRRQP